VRPATRAVGGIFALVILGGVAGAGAFVFFGSQAAVWSTVAIVPGLVIVGALWVRNTVQTTGTSQTEYTKRRAREVGERFRSFWERRERVHEAFPDLFAGGDRLSVDGVVTDLSESGIEFDTETGSLSVPDQRRDLEEINRLDGEVESLERRLDETVADGVRDRIRADGAELDRLSDLVAVDPPVDPADVSHPAETDDFQWQTVGSTYEDHREWVETTLDAAVDRIQATLRSADDVDEATVSEHLSDARTAASMGECANAVDSLLAARDVLSQTGEDVFRSEVDALRSLLRTVDGSEAIDRVDADHGAKLESLAAEVEAFDSAMDMEAVRATREELTSVCTAVVDDLASDLDDALGRLERADPPDGYYERPDAAETPYVERLRETDDLATYEHAWSAAAAALVDALDTVGPKVEVVSAYDQVADRIDERLRAAGRVDADDLPVREYERQFLGLYYRKNDGLEFDPGQPALTTGGDGETYDLDVTVRFESSGAERRVTVSLDGPGHEDERTVRTHLAAAVTFEAVPFGEYTVTATPATDESQAASASVTLDSDSEVALEMPDVTVRDRACEGLDDVDTYLADLEDRFATRFDSDGHLRSEMSFPIDDEYVPCLLATWADRRGHAAALVDGSVLVYDDETITRELENVIQYNLDAGETMSFDGLRENFLSAPLPDAEIRDLVAASTESESVSAESDSLTKVTE